MGFTVRKVLAFAAVGWLAAGCATAGRGPNPLDANMRQQLLLQDVVVTATSNASTGADSTTLEAVKPKLKSKLATSLAAGLKGTRPARVVVEITRLSVDQRVLSVTPVTTATVSVVDVGTGKTLASYRAGHEAPLGRATMVAVSTDDFIADGLAVSVASHVLNDHQHIDSAVPNAAGGVLGQIL